MKGLVSTIVLCVMLAATVHAQSREAAADRAIIPVRGDLYRVRDGGQETVFLVTPAGIIIGDPLSSETALWLQEQFDARFPERLVQFVVVSTPAFARTKGAGIFNDLARIVGPSEVDNAIQRARREFRDRVEALDRDGNNTLDQAEVAGNTVGISFAERDRNGDGRLSPQELYALVSSIEFPYDRRERITLGGRVVDLIQPPTAHTTELSVMFFPQERVVFAAALPGALAQPVRTNDFNAADVLAWARVVAPLEFDTLISGDGQTVTRAEVVALRQYLEALFVEVSGGYDLGRSIPELQTSLTFDKFRTAPFYAGRPAQIADLFHGVRLVTSEIYGFASGRFVLADPLFCEGYHCSAEEVVPVGTLGLRISGRQLGIAAEFAAGPQEIITRTSTRYDERIAIRDSRGSVLFRISSRPDAFSLAALAGLSATVTDASGEYLARATSGPLGGRHAFGSREWRYGFTAGVDATTRLSRSIGMLITLRATYALSPATGVTPARDLDVQAGLGFSIRTHRRVGGPR
jgi:hypothetical protein